MSETKSFGTPNPDKPSKSLELSSIPWKDGLLAPLVAGLAPEISRLVDNISWNVDGGKPEKVIFTEKANKLLIFCQELDIIAPDSVVPLGEGSDDFSCQLGKEDWVLQVDEFGQEFWDPSGLDSDVFGSIVSDNKKGEIMVKLAKIPDINNKKSSLHQKSYTKEIAKTNQEILDFIQNNFEWKYSQEGDFYRIK